MDNYKVALV